MALFAKVMGECRTENVYGIIRKGVSYFPFLPHILIVWNIKPFLKF
jgi:hypothetical protein